MEQATKRSRQCVLLLAFAAFWAVSAFKTAQACYGCGEGSDGKTSPGLACVVRHADRNHNWGYNSIGQICNYDVEHEVEVVCPLLRDVMDSTDGLSCVAATLVRLGGSYVHGARSILCGGGYLDKAAQWECIVQSKDATGLWGWWSDWQPLEYNFDANSTYQDDYVAQDWTWKLPDSYPVTTEHLQSGQYFLSCRLPRVDRYCGGANCLASFKWREK